MSVAAQIKVAFWAHRVASCYKSSFPFALLSSFLLQLPAWWESQYFRPVSLRQTVAAAREVSI